MEVSAKAESLATSRSQSPLALKVNFIDVQSQTMTDRRGREGGRGWSHRNILHAKLAGEYATLPTAIINFLSQAL